MKNLSTQSIGTIIAVLIVAAAGYWYFFTGTPAPTPLSASSAPSVTETQFLNLSSKLSPLSFDTSIFSDARFTSLQDLSQPILPETQGRPDPFAPIGK